MIIGFLLLAIVLGYWTVRAAKSMPVQETNDYMMKYQQADININDILKSKQRFDNQYLIELKDVEMMVMTDNVNSNRVQYDQVRLAMGPNRFSYAITDKAGSAVSDANVSFLLTRPHTTVDDQMIDVVSRSGERYVTPEINISKPGRYTLQLRVKIGNDTGYSHIEAYLQPEK